MQVLCFLNLVNICRAVAAIKLFSVGFDYQSVEKGKHEWTCTPNQ